MRALIPVFGTCILCGAAVTTGQLALQTSFEAPALLSADKHAEGEASTASAETSPELQRRDRPDIYYQAITDRPLFSPTRRPIELAPLTSVPQEPEEDIVVVEEPAPEQVIPEPDAILLGVMTNGALGSALVSLDGAQAVWRSEGDDLNGWTLRSIEADAIELNEADRSLRIELYRK